MTKKSTGEERREYILDWLKNSDEPLTGQIIAEKMNVSRQVIVQDISLLKAKNEPIIATSQGYVYMSEQQPKYPFKRIIACYHPPQQTKDELMILADYGVLVRDVTIEHPIYGELTASIMVKNRHDVMEFVKKMETINASYLSELTDGVHLHTLEAETIEQLDQAIAELEKGNFLLSKSE